MANTVDRDGFSVWRGVEELRRQIAEQMFGYPMFFKTADDRDVIRQYAMSTVPQLLNASARSAAMLFYLDNYTNIVGHAQENYARELMELHTLSVNAPYSQNDKKVWT